MAKSLAVSTYFIVADVKVGCCSCGWFYHYFSKFLFAGGGGTHISLLLLTFRDQDKLLTGWKAR